MTTKSSTPLLFLAAMAGCTNAWAEDVAPDGLWRGNGGAALSLASGNTRSSSLTLTGDAARQTEDNKLSLYGQVLSSRAERTSNGITTTSTTANQWQVGTRYDRNLTPTRFAFGGLDFAHDQIQLLSLRSAVSTGLGYHAIKTPETQWDLFAGLSYRSDRYSEPGVTIHNQTRTHFDVVELLFSEESTSRLTDSTSIKQRLVITPNMGSSNGFLAALDSGLLVAINRTLSLKVSLQDRYNSLSQAPIKKNDVLFFTGINWKFGDGEASVVKEKKEASEKVSESGYPPPCNLDPKGSGSSWQCAPLRP